MSPARVSVRRCSPRFCKVRSCWGPVWLCRSMKSLLRLTALSLTAHSVRSTPRSSTPAVHVSGVMEWVNAGHCAPFVLSANGSMLQLQTTGMPLGLWRNARYDVERLHLTPGDKIIAYSDGITEAENEHHETFEPQFRLLLKRFAALNAEQLHDAIISAVLQFHRGMKQRDDITALVLEYVGSS